MDVLSAVLLALLLIGANAFFVGAEFALISARRDRLEALAEQGKATAVTVIRAGEQLPAMLTGAQLGVTVSSILLGRVGEPAVVKLLQLSFGLSGVPPALLHTLSLAIVVALHVLLGEMVPKNIALAGPERTAMLLVPPYLVYVRLARPFIAFYNNCANAILRLVGVQPKDELDIAVSTAELSEMIAESAIRRPAGSRGAHAANPSPSDSNSPGCRCRGAAGQHSGSAGVGGRVRAHHRRGRTGLGANRLLPLSGGGSRWKVHRISAHQGRADPR